ncbi:MAG: hypothetical protein FJW80_00130 [Actinobacteria bacterium]|nr:hypothetical protein [Actinomycetota bacterium]
MDARSVGDAKGWQMSDRPQRPGRGLVIAGAILTGISVLVTVSAGVDSIRALTAERTYGIAFFGILLYWTILAAPTWYVGVPLLGIGRTQQRGPVKYSVWAWVVALAVLPVVFVATPLASVPSVAAAAWLVWGKPAQTPPVQADPGADVKHARDIGA